MQRWSFAQPIITIGRDENAQIPLADCYVSRVHLELAYGANGWELFARGKNGVLVNGRNIDSCPATPGLIFRLGAIGPMFRIGEAPSQIRERTLSIDPNKMIILALNTKQMVQQADEIAATDYFQHLQEKARKIRQQRSQAKHR